MGKIDLGGDTPFVPRIDDIELPTVNSGSTEANYDSDYSVRLATLAAMGGDTTKQYDSVYAIDLEILKLTEEGGGGKAIEEVDALPEASENTDKLFRVKGEDGIYAAKLLSSESITTNKLPDEQQIDKAFLYETEEDIYYYKGAYKIICSDGEISGYLWGESILSISNAVEAETSELPIYYIAGGAIFDDTNRTITADWLTLEEYKADNEEGGGFGGAGVTPIPATYNAPESAQIGNAYISSNDNMKFYYTGAETTIEVGGETINVYSWFKDGEGYVYSTKPASEIYYSTSDEPNTPIMTDTKFYGGGEEWNIYVAHIVQLNAPDEQQIDNAFISYPEDETVSYTYGGVKTFNCTDGTLDLYEWYTGDKETPDYRLFTRIPASDLYEHAYEISEETISDEYTVDWSTYDIEATVAEFQTLLDNTYWREWNCTTEKYTREETIEEWGWANILEGGSSLEAGDNISIEDNKISAVGYKAGNSVTSSFAELPERITEPYMDMTSQLPSTDLYFTGDAGATQYTVSGQLVAMIGTMVGMVAFQVGSGNIAKLLALDSTNNIVTLDKSLDNNNALSAAQMSNLYLVIEVQISGDANVKTYSYVDSTGGAFGSMTEVGIKIKIGDYALRTVTDITSNTITFDETLDADNAVSNVKWMYSVFVNNNASGIASHAEGNGTTASSNASHAEGNGTIASGSYSHAEGDYSEASGEGSHAEGGALSPVYKTLASGESSHAEGGGTVASGVRSHAEGAYTLAQNWAEHAEGKNNRSHKANTTWGNAGNTIHSIGIGGNETSSARGNGKNAIEVMQNGDVYVYGVGGYQGTDTHVQDENVDSLQMYLTGMETYIAALEQRIYNLEHPTTIE